MADIELLRSTEDSNVFELATFGRVRFPKAPSGAVVISVPGQADWQVSLKTGLLHSAWHAVETDGGDPQATFTKSDRRVVSGSRELILMANKPEKWFKPGSWGISEQGRQIVAIPRLDWQRKRMVVSILDEEVAQSDPRLTCFALWAASVLSRYGRV